MYTVKQLLPEDLFKLDIINLDKYSESFGLDYYLYYLKTYSEDCFCISNSDNVPVGYTISKLENKVSNINNSHLSAISVAPSYRRYNIGSILMDILETNAKLFNCKFVDLYVRQSNSSAYKFYQKLGYYIYRKVFGYYNNDEHAYDMRKYLVEGCNETGEDISADQLDQ